MQWTNYHSHTQFSDGSHSPEHYVISAIDKQMLAYGFSGHAPVPFGSDWTIKAEELGEYLSTIDRLKEKYADQITILKSLEIDYIPGSPMCWETTINTLGLDYTIGSIHFVGAFADGNAWNIDYSKELFDKGIADIYNGDLQKAVQDFYRLSIMMVEEMKPDIVGHIDKIKMFCIAELDQTADWYKEAVMEMLDCMKRYNSVMEVNTRGFYKKSIDELYPNDWILKEACKKGIPVTICSDSHHPSELTNEFEFAAKHILEAGYRNVVVLEDKQWVEKPFDVQNGISL